jgi:hypothetical protein
MRDDHDRGWHVPPMQSAVSSVDIVLDDAAVGDGMCGPVEDTFICPADCGP